MVDTALEAASAPYEIQEEDEDQDIPEPTPQKRHSKKRGTATIIEDTTAAPAQPAPAKKQKTEQQYDETSTIVQNPPHQSHHAPMIYATDDISDVFHELRKISAQIKQKR